MNGHPIRIATDLPAPVLIHKVKAPTYSLLPRFKSLCTVEGMSVCGGVHNWGRAEGACPAGAAQRVKRH